MNNRIIYILSILGFILISQNWLFANIYPFAPASKIYSIEYLDDRSEQTTDLSIALDYEDQLFLRYHLVLNTAIVTGDIFSESPDGFFNDYLFANKKWAFAFYLPRLSAF